MHVARQELLTGWEFRQISDPSGISFLQMPWIPARVPGHIHTDLMREGVIHNPFWRMEERACAWVDEADWAYRTTFSIDAGRLGARGHVGHHFLVFHGLDTVARVFLNGIPVGEAQNMFRPHRFDVTDTLREGENDLRVEFDSALRIGQERAASYLGDGTSERGKQAYFNFAPRAFIRKAQYMFGWDWGPELISCGIWQPVELVTVPVAEIRDWSCEARFAPGNDGDDGPAVVHLTADVERHGGGPLSLRATLHPHGAGEGLDALCDASTEVPEALGLHQVTLGLPETWLRRWRANGAGASHRYDLTLSLQGEQPVDTLRATIGFRQRVELVREPDADGTGEGFRFRIGGVDTFMKGANWIPDHSFPAAITRERLRERLTQARDVGFNMLRVWGGGLYETEDFYDLCDELGLIVWQDFAFACSMYPDDEEWFVEEVTREAVAAVRRIRNHPSLALWCGGNENLTLHEGRWNGEMQATRFFGDHTIHQVLPAVVAAEDPATPYLPNSPYGGEMCNCESHGDSHCWDVWHGKGDWVHYRDSECRFSSEFGFLAPCGMAAWEKASAPQDRWPRSPVAQWHDKSRKGYETYLGYIALHFPAPESFEDLIYYGQINQAEALKCGVEHWRRSKGRCWGTLIWQLNDCWPVQSWAMVDSEGEPKASYYAARRFYEPVLLSLVEHEGQVAVHLTSDLPEPVSGRVALTITTFTGETLAEWVVDACAPANAAAQAGMFPLATAMGREGEVYVRGRFVSQDWVQHSGNVLFLAEPKDLKPCDPGLSVSVCAYGEGTAAITVESERFAPYVWLRRADSFPIKSLADNFFHLFPGEQFAFGVDLIGLSPEALQEQLVVRTLWGTAP